MVLARARARGARRGPAAAAAITCLGSHGVGGTGGASGSHLIPLCAAHAEPFRLFCFLGGGKEIGQLGVLS